MIDQGSYGTKFQRKAYPQIKIKFVHPAYPNQLVETDALIDTGASGTLIPAGVVDQLALEPNNSLTMKDFEGNVSDPRPVYIVQVVIGQDTFDVSAAETKGYAIVGRDILNKLTLTCKGIQQKWEMV